MMNRLVPDWAWAVMTIYQEARGEPFEGKVAVAEVILRRTTKKIMSDGTVPGTVLKPFQFSGWNTQDPNRLASAKLTTDDPVVDECLRAWDKATTGSNLSAGATHYYSKKMERPPYWAGSGVEVAQIGNHRFMVVDG